MDGSYLSTRILCLGDLGFQKERDCDLCFFLHYANADFVHCGAKPAVHAVDRCISLTEARRRFLGGKYDLVVAGKLPTLEPNPRKSFFHRWAGVAGRLCRVASSWRGVRLARLLELFAPRLVILDMEDRPIIDNMRFRAASLCRLYFKRELPQNPCNAFLYTTARNEDNGNIQRQPGFAKILAKLKPISLGVEPGLAKGAEPGNAGKKYDVFFAGTTYNRPTRLSGLEQLRRLRAEGYRVDLPEERLSQEEFWERCAQSLVVWCPEGFGWDCFRTYETAAVGAVPLIQYPTIQRHAPLIDGEHALYYGVEEGQLYVKLKAALADREHLREMGRRAREHVERHHTFDLLARYVIEESLKVIQAPE
ncbi:MAG: glycosyltransferase [Chthoniobacteraceae bacterium]